MEVTAATLDGIYVAGTIARDALLGDDDVRGWVTQSYSNYMFLEHASQAAAHALARDAVVEHDAAGGTLVHADATIIRGTAADGPRLRVGAIVDAVRAQLAPHIARCAPAHVARATDQRRITDMLGSPPPPPCELDQQRE